MSGIVQRGRFEVTENSKSQIQMQSDASDERNFNFQVSEMFANVKKIRLENYSEPFLITDNFYPPPYKSILSI